MWKWLQDRAGESPGWRTQLGQAVRDSQGTIRKMTFILRSLWPLKRFKQIFMKSPLWTEGEEQSS